MEAYSQGNKAFVAGDYDLAVKFYSDCIAQVKDWLDASRDSSGLIFLKALCNRGYCLLKLRNYCDAAHDLSLSLQLLERISAQGDGDAIVPSLVEKCLLRRALCYEYMTEYTKAMIDMETLIRKFPNAISGKVVMELLSRLRGAIKRDEVAVHAEPRPDYLINSAQRLRLSFLIDLPSHISTETKIFCKLCIGNEFGLFKRSFFRPIHEDDNQRERIVLDLSDPIPTDNKVDESEFSSPPSAHIGRLGCSLIVLDGPAALAVLDIDGKSNPSWPIGPDGKANVSFSLHSLSGMSSMDKPIVVSMQFFVIEHQLSCGLSNSIMEVLSLPIFVNPVFQVGEGSNEGNGVLLRNLCEEVQASCIRRLDIPGPEPNSVYALESPGLLGIGGKIWDSSFVLIRYLAHHRTELITSKNVLELGSGTGVTGLSLARFLPLKMVVTDLAPVVPLMKANIFLNKCVETNPDVARIFESHYDAVEHAWGEGFSSRLVEVDWQTIIAADVIYNPEFYEPLYLSIKQLLLAESVHGRQFILAHRHRHPEDKVFFQMILDDSMLDMKQINWMDECGMMDNVDIKVFRIVAEAVKCS